MSGDSIQRYMKIFNHQSAIVVSSPDELKGNFILVPMSPPTTTTRTTGDYWKRCFKCSCNSRISPIIEEEPTLKSWTQQQDDVEIFDSRTRINLTGFQLKKSTIKSTNTFDVEGIKLTSTRPLPMRNHKIDRDNVGDGGGNCSLWPFGRPNARPAVHKTYFVRWTKPPETLWNGYGVDRLYKVELRRCRSAVF